MKRFLVTIAELDDHGVIPGCESLAYFECSDEDLTDERGLDSLQSELIKALEFARKEAAND